jgi:hypothetical protein
VSRLAPPPRRGVLGQMPLEAPRASEPVRHRRGRAECRPGPASTLGERLSGALETLRSGGAAECALCQGPMTWDGRVGSCRDCGSTLS